MIIIAIKHGVNWERQLQKYAKCLNSEKREKLKGKLLSNLFCAKIKLADKGW